jgi:hypothetical protein
VLQEMLAKLNPREKLIVYGGVAVALGVVVGLILGSKEACASFAGQQICSGVSVNYFTAENAGLFAILALVGAVLTLGVVYTHVAPNVNVTLPAPYAQALVALAGITAACAILVVLMQLIRAGGFGPEPPIFMYVADIAVVAGGALMGYAAYMEWTASKTAA